MGLGNSSFGEGSALHWEERLEIGEKRSAPYILYGTSACHLCDLAEALLLAERGGAAAVDFKKVDISESDALFERYGLRIPVLLHPAGGELGWPFNAADVRRFTGS